MGEWVWKKLKIYYFILKQPLSWGSFSLLKLQIVTGIQKAKKIAGKGKKNWGSRSWFGSSTWVPSYWQYEVPVCGSNLRFQFEVPVLGSQLILLFKPPVWCYSPDFPPSSPQAEFPLQEQPCLPPLVPTMRAPRDLHSWWKIPWFYEGCWSLSPPPPACLSLP